MDKSKAFDTLMALILTKLDAVEAEVRDANRNGFRQLNRVQDAALNARRAMLIEVADVAQQVLVGLEDVE